MPRPFLQVPGRRQEPVRAHPAPMLRENARMDGGPDRPHEAAHVDVDPNPMLGRQREHVAEARRRLDDSIRDMRARREWSSPDEARVFARHVGLWKVVTSTVFSWAASTFIRRSLMGWRHLAQILQLVARVTFHEGGPKICSLLQEVMEVFEWLNMVTEKNLRSEEQLEKEQALRQENNYSLAVWRVLIDYGSDPGKVPAHPRDLLAIHKSSPGHCLSQAHAATDVSDPVKKFYTGETDKLATLFLRIIFTSSAATGVELFTTDRWNAVTSGIEGLQTALTRHEQEHATNDRFRVSLKDLGNFLGLSDWFSNRKEDLRAGQRSIHYENVRRIWDSMTHRHRGSITYRTDRLPGSREAHNREMYIRPRTLKPWEAINSEKYCLWLDESHLFASRLRTWMSFAKCSASKWLLVYKRQPHAKGGPQLPADGSAPDPWCLLAEVEKPQQPQGDDPHHELSSRPDPAANEVDDAPDGSLYLPEGIVAYGGGAEELKGKFLSEETLDLLFSNIFSWASLSVYRLVERLKNDNKSGKGSLNDIGVSLSPPSIPVVSDDKLVLDPHAFRILAELISQSHLPRAAEPLFAAMQHATSVESVVNDPSHSLSTAAVLPLECGLWQFVHSAIFVINVIVYAVSDHFDTTPHIAFDINETGFFIALAMAQLAYIFNSPMNFNEPLLTRLTKKLTKDPGWRLQEEREELSRGHEQVRSFLAEELEQGSVLYSFYGPPLEKAESQGNDQHDKTAWLPHPRPDIFIENELRRIGHPHEDRVVLGKSLGAAWLLLQEPPKVEGTDPPQARPWEEMIKASHTLEHVNCSPDRVTEYGKARAIAEAAKTQQRRCRVARRATVVILSALIAAVGSLTAIAPAAIIIRGAAAGQSATLRSPAETQTTKTPGGHLTTTTYKTDAVGTLTRYNTTGQTEPTNRGPLHQTPETTSAGNKPKEKLKPRGEYEREYTRARKVALLSLPTYPL
ncbi:unnamed protein product [Amoebophrya sp. A25]|nr:unnamed protein product [Amoebophrya sp. A25]|eukprot:GSA25T00018651001.1